MTVRPVQNISDYATRAAAHVGVFASSKWLSVYEDTLSVMGIYDANNTLIGGFYYTAVKRYGFSFFKLAPYTPHCGLFYATEGSNRSNVNSFGKEVMQAVCEHFLKKKAALTVLAFPSRFVDLQPFIWNKFKVVPNYTYQIDLDRSIEEIRSHFDPKNRNMINKAVKHEVTVGCNTVSHEALFTFFEKSLKQAGARVYKRELWNIFHRFANDTNSFSFSAMKDNTFAGAVFCIFDKQTCYYLLGGTTKSGLQGVNNLLIQHSIEKAKALGCRTFDFEGSMLRGVEKFFRSFGGELVPYYTANKAMLPLELLLKFKKRELF